MNSLMCVCVCLRVCEGVCERVSVCVHACECVCVCVCMCDYSGHDFPCVNIYLQGVVICASVIRRF